MSNEERLTLNTYLEALYQAMQIGDIVYEPKHSSELYNLINKLLKENQKYKEVINRAIDYINSNPNVYYDEHLIDVETLKANEMTDKVIGEIKFISKLLSILKEVEHE